MIWIPEKGEAVMHSSGIRFTVVTRTKSPEGRIDLWDNVRTNPTAIAYPLEECRPYLPELEQEQPKPQQSDQPSEELMLYQRFLAILEVEEEPFELSPAVVVLSPSKWLFATQVEVRTAIDYLKGEQDKPSPRQKLGALQRDVKAFLDKQNFAA